MTKSPRKNVPRPSAYQAVRASVRASAPSRKDILKIVEWMGTFFSETSANRHNSGKFETLIALQNDLRWLLLHSWFSKSGGGPRITLQEEILGVFLLSNLCATLPPPSHTDTKTLLFAMIIYDFVIRGFICSLLAELPLPHPLFSYITSASARIRLLLCNGKLWAVFCFVSFVVFCFCFCWKR